MLQLTVTFQTKVFQLCGSSLVKVFSCFFTWQMLLCAEIGRRKCCFCCSPDLKPVWHIWDELRARPVLPTVIEWEQILAARIKNHVQFSQQKGGWNCSSILTPMVQESHFSYSLKMPRSPRLEMIKVGVLQPGIMGGAEWSGVLQIAAYKDLICIPVSAPAPRGSRRARIMLCSLVD